MSEAEELLSGLLQELRRGTLIISVLSQLSEPQYGYSLVARLESKGIAIDPGTLYPLLRRLEKQGLLESQWDTQETRPRKYYLLSALGIEIYGKLCEEWRTMVASMDHMIGAD